MKQDLKKEEFYSFISQMSGLNYFGDLQDRKFFHKCLLRHVVEGQMQKKYNINSYFKSGSNRLKMIEALEFVREYMPTGFKLEFDRVEGVWCTDWKYQYKEVKVENYLESL